MKGEGTLSSRTGDIPPNIASRFGDFTGIGAKLCSCDKPPARSSGRTDIEFVNWLIFCVRMLGICFLRQILILELCPLEATRGLSLSLLLLLNEKMLTSEAPSEDSIRLLFS